MLREERINELAWIARDAGPDVMLLLKANIRQAAIEAAREEREACAKVCDERAVHHRLRRDRAWSLGSAHHSDGVREHDLQCECEEDAAAILAREATP